MLPHHVYKHYYDQLCQECEDEMVSQEEVHEEGGKCGTCDKVMCEDCRDGQNCNLCLQLLEDDEEPEEDNTAVCSTCEKKCPHCPDHLVFHPYCFTVHSRDCNATTRAHREIKEINDRLNEIGREAQRMVEEHDRLVQDRARIILQNPGIVRR